MASFCDTVLRGTGHLRRLTLEVLPQIENYRHVSDRTHSSFRPTLEELHQSNPTEQVTTRSMERRQTPLPRSLINGFKGLVSLSVDYYQFQEMPVS